MKVAFFDLKRLYRLTEHDVDREIRHVLESGHYVLGGAGQAFEAALKTSIVGPQKGFAIGCNSGTDALILPLLALDVSPGDEVITVSHTAIPTITAIRATGATPVFADIDAKTWMMDLDHALKLISERTKAIVAVHLYGNMVDIPALKARLKAKGREDIAVIEDCAQAQGSNWMIDDEGHAAGSMGDFGAYSFYPTKNIGALGDAGAVFTKNEERADRLRMLRFYGQKDRYNALIDRGLNSRLDEMQAAILTARMKYLKKWGDRKADMMERYRRDLEGLPLVFQEVSQDCRPNWHLCVVRLAPQFKRDEVLEKLNNLEVTALIHYPIPTHTQKAFEKFARGPLPVTEALAKEIISLPMNPTLMPEEVEHVIASVRKVLS